MAGCVGLLPIMRDGVPNLLPEVKKCLNVNCS